MEIDDDEAQIVKLIVARCVATCDNGQWRKKDTGWLGLGRSAVARIQASTARYVSLLVSE